MSQKNELNKDTPKIAIHYNFQFPTFLIAVAVDDNPGDIGVGRFERLCGHCKLVEKSVAEAALKKGEKLYTEDLFALSTHLNHPMFKLVLESLLTLAQPSISDHLKLPLCSTHLSPLSSARPCPV